MISGPETVVLRVIAALNSDILRELRMADQCIRWAASLAGPYLRFRGQIVHCAALAQSNACALACEVLALGGAPPGRLRRREARRARQVSIEEYCFGAQSLMRHYQERLIMAERFGMLRFREVIQDILASKRIHLQHAAVIAAAVEGARQLS